MSPAHKKALAELVNEAEALCHVYIGKDAESEQWIETCRRLERLDKIIKRIRKAERQP